MLCTTLSNGECALDLTWFRDNPAAQPTLEPVFTFNKVIDKTLTEDDISDYTDVLLRYTEYYGYVVRTNNARSDVIVSRTGHSDIFDLWVHKDFVMLIYRKAADSSDACKVYVVGSATMNIPFRDLTPLSYLASPMAKLLGTPSSSYLIVGGSLFETFDCATVGIMDANYQIYSGMSLVAAFEPKAGSLGLNYFPANKRAALAMFFNKKLANCNFVSLPSGWGIYFTSQKRAQASSIINNIRNGLAIKDLDWCKVYPTPQTAARTTAALPSFVCKFAGKKPMKALGTGDEVEVSYKKVIFKSPLPGEGIRDWVNGAPEWEAATYFESNSADLAGIVMDYNQFMQDLFKTASDRIIKGLNSAITQINAAIDGVQSLGAVNFTANRKELLNNIKINSDIVNPEHAIGRLTKSVVFQYNVPIKQLFPQIAGKVTSRSSSLNEIINSIQQNTPRLWSYLQLLDVRASVDGKQYVMTMPAFVKDTRTFDEVSFGVVDDVTKRFSDVISGDSENALTRRINAQLYNVLAAVVNGHAAGSSFVLSPSDDARQTFGYTYGCKHKYVETAWGWWIGAEQVDSISWNVANKKEDKNIFNAFPVFRSPAVVNTTYGSRLRENGFTDAVGVNRAPKAFDFELEKVIINDFTITNDGRVGKATTIQVYIDDFELEQKSRFAQPKGSTWANALRGIWQAQSFPNPINTSPVGEVNVHYVGTGKYCLPSIKHTVKTGSCFWNKSTWGGLVGSGRNLEEVFPSQRYKLVFTGDCLNGLLGSTASAFIATDETPLEKCLSKLNADLNTLGFKYLLGRLAQYGDLKECKMLVKAETVYILPILAKYFTRLYINEAGAKSIQKACEDLISLKKYGADGKATEGQVMDEETISALREIASDMASLALSASENQPWYARSTDIAVASGKRNLDALGLYLYL